MSLPAWAASMQHGPTWRTKVLWAPEGFWEAWSSEVYAKPPLSHLSNIHSCWEGCNGCGTRGFDVPDTMWGLRVTICCNIHDVMCGMSNNSKERRWTDQVFFQNLCAWIRQESAGAMMYPRLLRALLYFRGVKIGTWAQAKGIV